MAKVGASGAYIHEVVTRHDGEAPPDVADRSDTPPLIGPYTVLGRLGRGAMGTVFGAYDAKLDRKIALKLVAADSSAGTQGHARLLREAQTLARVSHPNVVQIYEVGEHHHEVYIAMEFVRGETLRSWTQAKPRTWREILEVFVQAGRGLAAAHAAGVVHRDFKPDNVMVGDDGRVRVMDFGLARALSGSPASEPELAALVATDGALALTTAGARIGTPAYMAPEQHLGQEASERSDQFSFCVALFEALHGQRPFAGNDLGSLSASVLGGEIRAVPTRAVPGWLRRAILRGLAVNAAERWPDMPALLREISRGQTRARVRGALATCAVVGLIGAGVLTWHRVDVARRTDACVAAGAEIAEDWGDPARSRVRAALLATGASYAATTAERVIPELDRHAESWRRAREEGCLDADLHGTWGADLLARSQWCLEERRMRFDDLVDELSRADEQILQAAIPAIAGLESPTACRDAALLARLPAPPSERRDEIRAVWLMLSRAANLLASGKYEAGLKVAGDAKGLAEALDWPPIAASARLRLGALLEAQGKYAEAEAELEEAVFAAAEAGAPGVVADAETLLVDVVGRRLARPADGRRWSRFAAQTLRSIEPEPGPRTATNLQYLGRSQIAAGAYADAIDALRRSAALRESLLGPTHVDLANTLNDLASAHMEVGAYAEARPEYERSLAIASAALGPDHPSAAALYSSLGGLDYLTGDLAKAKAEYERAAALQEVALGPEHPELSTTLNNLAIVHDTLGEHPQAEPLFERSIAIAEKTLGPDHPELAASLSNLANVRYARGDYAGAKILNTRALAVTEKALGPDHPDLAQILGNLAAVLERLREYREAAALGERALAITEKSLGPAHANVGIALKNLANVRFLTGDRAAARTLYQRSLAVLERALGPDHATVAAPLSGLAQLALLEGRPAEVMTLASRVVALREPGGAGPEALAEGRFLLAQGLWEVPPAQGRDRPRALVLAEQARDAYRAAAAAGRQLAEVENWLAQRPASK